MTPDGSSLVIDASVAVKLFLPEEGADKAEVLIGRLEGDRPITIDVPDLFLVECANVFRTWAARGAMSSMQAMAAFETLAGIPVRIVETSDLAADALGLALETGISVYDALYTVLAIRLDATFVTADTRLVRSLRSKGIRVAHLGEVA